MSMYRTPQILVLGDITLRVPPEYRDETYYVFRSPSGDEELIIDASDEPVPTTPADAAHERAHRSRAVLGNAVSVRSDDTAQIGGVDAHQVILSVGEGGSAAVTRLLVIARSKTRLLTITHTTSPDPTDGTKQWKSIRDSVTLPPERGTVTTPAGFVHRAFPEVALNVPVHLTRPEAFTLRDAAGKISLAVAVWDVLAGRAPVSLEQEALRSAEAARGAQYTQRHRAVAGGIAEIEEFVQTDDDTPPTQQRVLRARAFLRRRLKVLLEVEGAEASAEKIQGIADGVLDSLTLAGGER